MVEECLNCGIESVLIFEDDALFPPDFADWAVEFFKTDDVVTSYTYTDFTESLPAGLLLSETDPLGRVTKYGHYSSPTDPVFGRLKSKTYAAGTADEAVVSFEDEKRGRKRQGDGGNSVRHEN